MSYFRKKPVVIEAFQMTQKIHDDFWFSEDGTEDIPVWFVDALHNSTVSLREHATIISTLEGDHRVSIGDWIIRGVKGELYPCKPDIFAETYVAAEDPRP